MDLGTNRSPLIPQALDLIYKDDEDLIPAQMTGQFAMSMYIEDFYRLVCSLIICAQTGVEELTIMPKEEFPPLTHYQQQMMLRHPIFSLYCSKSENEVPCVFFEEYFWAIWERSLLNRYVQT